MSAVRGILLAAGASVRFGANKLLQQLPDGTPVAVASARNLVAVLPDTVAVVRPGSAELEALLREAGCEVVVCECAFEGMGYSLSHAVAASGDVKGWVVTLADMPFIKPETLRSVADAVTHGALIAAPSLNGERGHPVGLAASLREELEAITGDEGARRVLKKHVNSIQLIPTDDAGVLRDIDRPEDMPNH